MTKKKQTDQDLFNRAKEHAADLRAMYGARNSLFQAVEDMYMLRWAEASNRKLEDAGARVTLSPDARNNLKGAMRLMIASDPQFNIEPDPANEQLKGNAEKLEKAINRMWYMAGRVYGEPIHYENIFSSLLYSEMHTAVTSTRDLVELARKNKGIGQARAERIQAMTPFLIEPWNPKDGYPEFDRLGLCAYLRDRKISLRNLRQDYGADNLPAILASRKDSEELQLHVLYDLQYTHVWVDEGLILQEEHGLSFIPVAVQLTEGSKLMEKPEDQREPFLYTLLKSRMWNRQNLALTVLYTAIFAIGANPMFIHTAPQSAPEKRLDVDFDTLGGVINLQYGEGFAPLLSKGVIDPSMITGLEIAERKVTESTIYRQALGEPLAGADTFSTVSLLAQSGRLPLIGTQRRGGDGIAGIVELVLSRLKDEGKQYKANGIDLSPADIPEYVQVNTKLDVSLPQDKLQLANIGMLLDKGGLADKEWIRQNILNINQSADMDERIWAQNASYAMFGQYLTEEMAKRQPAQPGPSGGILGASRTLPGKMPPMPPSGPTGPQMGEPMQGGLPQAQAGMLPGMGEGVVPPEGGLA